jgi:hypothetical protein
MANDHEVEFHEIKIAIFHEIEIAIMRLKFYLFMRSKLTIIFHNFNQEVNTLIMRSTLKKALLAIFDRIIVLVTKNQS